MSKEFIKPILRECKYCGSKNLVLENKSKLSIMEAPQVSLKCADCGKWIKWCPKDERKFYLKEVDKDQQIAELKAENAQLQQQLKDNTKQVCERIRKNIVKYVYGGNLFDIKGFKEFLDQIEEGENNEN